MRLSKQRNPRKQYFQDNHNDLKSKPVQLFQQIVPVQAEQFDGSQAMIDKYHVFIYHGDHRYELEDDFAIDHPHYFNIGDWIITSYNKRHFAVSNEDFRKVYRPITNQTKALKPGGFDE